MTRLASAVLALLPVLAVGVAAGCVGDDPQPVEGITPSEAGTPDTDGASSSDGSGGTDGASSCPAGFAECDGDPSTVCETDTRSSTTHCGACNRTCGGTATCAQSECSVERLKDGLNHPFALAVAGPRLVWYEGSDAVRGCRADDCGASTAILADVTASTVNGLNGSGSPRQIAVDGSNFYFSQCPTTTNTDCRISVCAVTGCKGLGPGFLAGANGYRRPLIVVGGPGAVYTHHGLDGLIRTDLVAKTESAVSGTYRVGEFVGAMHVDAQRFVWVDDNASQANPTGGVYVCPITGCTTTPTMLLPSPVRLIAFANDTAFTTTGGTNASKGSILGCAVTGCAGGGTVLAQNQAYTSDIAADGKAVYWTTTGAPDFKANSAAVGTVMRCALPSCAGGPVKIADQVLNPVSVRIDDNYVYWMSFGTPGGADGAVFRKRR